MTLMINEGIKPPAKYVYYDTDATHDVDGDLGRTASVLDVTTAGTFTLTRPDGTDVGPMALGVGTYVYQYIELVIAGGGAAIAGAGVV